MLNIKSIALMITACLLLFSSQGVMAKDKPARLLVKMYCGGSWGQEKCPVKIEYIAAIPSNCRLLGHDGGAFPTPGYIPVLDKPALFKVRCDNLTPTGTVVKLTGEAFENGQCTLDISATEIGQDCKMNEQKYPQAYAKQVYKDNTWRDSDGAPLISMTYAIEKQ